MGAVEQEQERKATQPKGSEEDFSTKSFPQELDSSTCLEEYHKENSQENNNPTNTDVHEIIEPTTYVVSQIPERPDISQDPRVIKITGLINYLEQETDFASDLEKGARHNVESTQREIDNSGFFMWASGGLEGLKQTLDQDNKLLGIRKEDRIALSKALKTSKEILEEAKKLELEGREAEKAGKFEEAQKKYNQAQQKFEEAAKTTAQALKTRVNSSIKVTEVIRGLTQANETLSNATQNLDKTETALIITRNTAVAVGATVATGGIGTACVSAGYGLTATFAISVAGGTATGVGIGLVSSSAEALNSDRSLSESAELILKNAYGDLQTAAIASIATASGMTFTNVIAKPGSAILVSNTGKIFVASCSGATGSAVTKIIEVPINYIGAVIEFERLNGNKPKEEKEELYKQFMTERHLSW